MNDDMTTKYQQHYNQILSGTLSDTIIKSISYQANIKLANEIIAEQEKTISELREKVESVNSELDALKSMKSNSENQKIYSLETSIKSNQETISKLNSELQFANKIKAEFESLKSQSANIEIFRNQLIKERESHQKTKNDYDLQIEELKNQIEILQAPPKRKKTVKSTPVESTIENVLQSESEDLVKDGGTF